MKTQQTVPHVHKVLAAILELEKLPVIKAYIKLLESLPKQN